MLRTFGWLLAVAVILLAWQLVTGLGLVDRSVLPSVTDTVAAVYTDVRSAAFWQDVAHTSLYTAVGLVVGMVIGIVGAVICFAIPGAFRLLSPYLTFLNSMPRVILVPLFVLFFGLGASSEVAVAASLVLFPVLFGAYGGFAERREDLVQSIRILGGRASSVWRLVIVPSALSSLIAAARLGLSLALLGTVITEMLIVPYGLGALLRLRAGVFDVAGLFSVVLVLAVITLVANAVVDAVAARLRH
ncbi:ABC transporter permease [Actinophytocola sp.]|uniref:ABC transporter permease n=1 Tax=Actinophytocola sp. TaxID=1872138 RepID=UPI003D6B9063